MFNLTIQTDDTTTVFKAISYEEYNNILKKMNYTLTRMK